MRRGWRWVVWTIGSLLALFLVLPAIAIAAFLIFGDWNDARPLVARLAERAIGHPVDLAGDLTVDLGRVTRIRLADVTIGNGTAGAGPAPQLLRVGTLDMRIALPPLLRGDIVIPSLTIADVDANLEVDPRGRGNWQTGDMPKAPHDDRGDANDARLPLIEALTVTRTRIAYDDQRIRRTSVLVLDRLHAGEDEQRTRMTIEGSGRYQDRPASLQATMGSLTVLKAGEPAYPIDVTVSAGDLKAHVVGTMANPQALQGLDLRMQVSGDDLSNLYPLTGIPIPPTPPYRLSGRLERRGQEWMFKGFSGSMGNSDLRGDMTAAIVDGRPRISADVASNRLDLKDLAGFIGASEGGREAQVTTPGGGRVLPDKDVDLQQLRAIDADIRFRGTRVITPNVPVETIDAKIALANGTLRVQPTTFAIAGGKVRVFLSLYGAEQPVRSDIETVIEKIDLRKLLSDTDFVTTTAGTFNGRIKLASTGTSVADIAATSTGEIMVLMSDGRFSRLLVELIGLDVFESLGIVFSSDESVPVRCIVADLAADQGLFTARTLVFDTTDTNVVGSGTINMREEALDLRLHAYPKDFSPFTLRTPLSVQGTLAEPDAFPDPANIGAEGSLQKALNAVLTVVSGLLNPVDVGSDTDAACEALMAQVRARLTDRRREAPLR